MDPERIIAPPTPLPARTTHRLRRFGPPVNTPISKLYEAIQGNLLHMNSPDSLYAMCGTVAANILEGPPVWLLFVAPPGSGKSELLKMLSLLPHVEFVSSITGEQAFLSGSSSLRRSKAATGGLLPKIGDHGMIVTDDLTRMLDLPSYKRAEIMAAERDIYSGDYGRSLGVDGGVNLAWKGHLGRLGGITDSIDHYQLISSALGERWIYYRWPPPVDANEQARFALRNNSRLGWREELAALTLRMFEESILEFGHPILPYHELTDIENDRLIDIAQFACHCRSVVTRDPRTTEILSHKRGVEGSSRLAKSLGQLFVGMAQIGVPESDCWKIVGRCALDSMSAIRQDIVIETWRHPEGITYKLLQERSGMSYSTIRRSVEDLVHHDVIEVPDAAAGRLAVIFLKPEIKRVMNQHLGGALYRYHPDNLFAI